MFLGVDGCPAGWYVVRSESVAGPISGAVYTRFVDVLADARGADVIAVDMPIGLRLAGSRTCDELARRALAPNRRSSVFPAPLRPVLAATSHAEASSLSKRIDGKGMSIQSFGIMRKVHEVDCALRDAGQFGERVFEVHPELCFAALNRGVPMTCSKKTAAGRAERLDLLVGAFGDAPDRLVQQRFRRHVGADDVVDACGALWSAVRIARGEHVSLPATPERDPHGRRMAIFY